MDKKLITSGHAWVPLNVPAIDTVMYCESRVAIPAHEIEVALRYPSYEDGTPVVDITQQGVADLMRGYPEFKGGLTLYEDQLLRDTFGNIHTIFDENYQRNGMPWRWGYVFDFSRPSGEGADGVEVDGQSQRLVTREIGYRLPGGDAILGVTTIAPSGMVPLLTKEELEACRVDLSKLEKLGVSIADEGIIRPTNALGYPQLTFPHKYQRDGKLVSHSHHLYTPTQNDSERVGVRGAGWHDHGGSRCFGVDLGVEPEDSDSDWSFSLVRGEKVKFEVERPKQELYL